LLAVKELKAGYDKLKVLYGVSFEVREREILAVVGPNGSGKSTLLKAIFGLATVHGGKVVFEGEDITGLPPHVKAKRGLAYLPQIGNTFERLTVYENLMMAGYTLSKEELKERMEEVLSFLPYIAPYLGRKVWNLSGGERQMVAMAMALMRRAKVLMIDEPTAALAPKVVKKLLRKITELRDVLGKGVILVEQNARSALEICDRALLLVAGKQIFLGDPNDLLSDRDLARTYLGVK